MKKALSLILIILLIVTTMASCEILGGNSGNNGGNTDSGNNDGNTNVGDGENGGNTNEGGNTDSGDNGGNTDSGNTGDSGNQGQSKRVPIYQGMTISSVKESASVSTLPSYFLPGDHDHDRPIGPGQHEGDHVGKDEAVDEENPYPDNSENENIETEIESSLKVEGAVHDIYYATPNEDIYIYIHINNPDNFEIVSFTLNGKKYASYMFEDGSDMETIILKYNVGGSRGIVEYTIDAIKYIDGTEIKDVIIDGDKTVRAGVKTENQVVANISDLNVGTNSLSFNVNVKDYNGLVEYFEGGFKAVLYDGTNIVAEKSIELGDNGIAFDGLKTNTLYQYAIVAYYDDLSGSGFGMHMLHKDALYTESVVLFDNIMIGQDSIDFTLNWHEDHLGKSLTSLKLYKDGSLVKDIGANATSVNGLLSANTYTIVAEYRNGDETESIYLDFTTFEKGVPGFSLNVGSVTQNSISFNIHEVDEENVGSITKIELVHKNGTTVAENIDVREFNDLLSDNEYTVRVTYTYNLNDGSGDKTIIKEFKSTTHKKEVPQISIFVPEYTQTSIWFDIFEKDSDKVGEITAIDVKDKYGNIVKSGTDIRMISGLLSDSSYEMVVTYTYNLNDGNGDHVDYYTAVGTTLAKVGPTISIINPSSTQDAISFEINESDVDNVGSVTKVELIDKNGKTVASGENVRTFVNLLSNNTYTIRVTYTYNLNDGNGDQVITEDMAVTTLAKAEPTVSIVNPSSTQESVSFEISENDADSVGSITKIELVHKNGTVVAENVDVREFTELLSNNEYSIKVTYTYDLNDGNGEKTIVKELAVTTLAKATPSVSVINPSSTQDSVSFEISESDTDNVGAITKIELVHKNGTVVAENVNVREFAELLSNNEYTIKVTYAYDLNDGNDKKTIVKELGVTTLAKATPQVSISDEEITQNSIKINHSYYDPDNVLIDCSFTLYSADMTFIATNEDEIFFNGLNYYTNYIIAFSYTYDLNDGYGVRTESIPISKTTLPYIDVTGCNIANTSAVSEGDTIFMQVTLDNPLNMAVESVVINGETYNVTGASTSKKIFVEIVYNGQFAGGDTYLKIDKVNAKIDSTSISIEPKSELADNVFINGKLEVISAEYVNENFEPIDYFIGSREEGFTIDYIVLIKLNNPTGYNIDSITSSGNSSTVADFRHNDLIKLDDNTWYYHLTWYYKYESLLSFSINKVSYSNEYISKTIDFGALTDTCFVCTEKVKVSTPDDLKRCSSFYDYYYYELTNDIDLSGIEWQGANFKGVLEGNGYSIKNMSFVGSKKNTDAYLGLFSSGCGVIQNLNLKEATIIADLSSNDGKQYNIYCGGIVGATDDLYLKLNNCSVDEYSIFSVSNSTQGFNYVGGLVGSVNHQSYTYATVHINNCVNSANISLAKDSKNSNVGGLIGSLLIHEQISFITNSTNNGIVSGQDNVGGLVGGAYAFNNITFENCTNNGSVSGNSHVGGFVGYSSHSMFENCTNNGNIVGKQSAGGFIGTSSGDSTVIECINNGMINIAEYTGGFIGYADNNYTIKNCVNTYKLMDYFYIGGLIGYTSINPPPPVINSYSMPCEGIGVFGEICTIEQLNSKEFYTDVLGWSEDVWDLSELDIENGKYPKLK